MDVLIEVNIGQEASKSGCAVADLPALAEEVAALPHMRLKGLMSVLPIDAEDSLYDGMKKLFDKTAARYQSVEYLSVGMSGDYEKAVMHGANMIRPGSLLFGARTYPARA